MGKKVSKVDFIKRVNILHNDFYDYSLVDDDFDYRKKVKIICPVHGVFEQKPSCHLRNKGCMKCGLIKQVSQRTDTKESFIEKAKKLNSGDFNYDDVVYINARTPVKIHCNTHNLDFLQRPEVHLRGSGCNECRSEKISKSGSGSKEDFLKRMNKRFPDLFEYDLSGFQNLHSLIKIKCKKHNEWFTQTGTNHISSSKACPICVRESLGEATKSNTEEFKKKGEEVHGGKYNYDKSIYVNTGTKVSINCLKCGNDFEQTPNKHIVGGQGCPVCARSPISYRETKLYEYISEIYDGEIVGNTRELINEDTLTPQEIDIYLPELKMGVEFVGLYWHSDLKKENTYHLYKTNTCNDKGIRLIHIFEDEWKRKLRICKSNLSNIMNLSEVVINGKFCEIKVIDDETCGLFLQKTHLSGGLYSDINLGLFYNDSLVSVMVYKKVNNGEYELLRFSEKLNTKITNGYKKLFKYFIEIYKPTNIISYGDIRWEDEKFYTDLGFILLERTEPDYFYVVNKCRMDKEIYENKKREISGVYKIYDCGKMKMLYKK